MKKTPKHKQHEIDFKSIHVRMGELQSMCRDLDAEICNHADQIKAADERIVELRKQIANHQDLRKQAEMDARRKSERYHEIFDDVLRYRRIHKKHFSKNGRLMQASEIKAKTKRA